jgi:hypothetical protein
MCPLLKVCRASAEKGSKDQQGVGNKHLDRKSLWIHLARKKRAVK